jgi:hypothetical protein
MLSAGTDPLSVVICSLRGVSEADENDEDEDGMISGYMHKIGTTADKLYVAIHAILMCGFTCA